MPGRKVAEEARREDLLRAAYDVAARHGIEALTVRSVAARAKVCHGTVLLHFKRREQLVAALLERVIYATMTLRVSDVVATVTRPSDRMLALLRAEMERLAADPRHFRLFLECWTLGVRRASVRRSIGAAVESYRLAFRDVAEAVLAAEDERRTRRTANEDGAGALPTPDGLAAVAVSLIHGCALQALIEPKHFDVEAHFAAASGMLRTLSSGPPRSGRR
jgi:AcrR family transcriptional regulator